MPGDVADEYFDSYCRLDPAYATLAGRAGFDGLPDYSPQGWAARAALLGDTLRRLEPGGLATEVLRERLAAELGYLESGLGSALNIVTSPPMLIRTCLEQTAGTEALCRRLRSVPAALAGYLRTLAEGRPPARRQAEVLVGATRAWSRGLAFGDAPEVRAAAAVAARGYADFADALERDVLPRAREEDGVGREAYAVAARYLLGDDPDVAETYEWLGDRLRVLRAAAAALARDIAPGLGLRAVCDRLDRSIRLDGTAALRAWMTERLDRSSDLARDLVEVPEPLRHIEVVVGPVGEPGPIRYLPPASDLSRPGRIMWSPAEESNPVWSALTMIHHEGVPGHHLQVGAAVLDRRLPLWQRHTTVFGHAEGWAVYAEGLMAEAVEPAERLGYLLGLVANVAVAMVDIGIHTLAWSPDRALAFLREHTLIGEGMLYFTVLRTAAWPGQALAYAYGERAWLDARRAAERLQGKDFVPREFHTRMLGIGPCGLSVLSEQACVPPRSRSPLREAG